MSAPDKLNISWVEGSDDGRVEYTTAGRFLDTGVDYVRRDLTVLADLPEVHDMIRQAVEAEREACAVVTETMHETSWPDTIAAAIRAREGKA